MEDLALLYICPVNTNGVKICWGMSKKFGYSQKKKIGLEGGGSKLIWTVIFLLSQTRHVIVTPPPSPPLPQQKTEQKSLGVKDYMVLY